MKSVKSMSVLLTALAWLVCLVAAQPAAAQSAASGETPSWQESFGTIPIQHEGRVMPMDTYARRLAVTLTGRASWREGKGPEVFQGRPAVELLADLIARPQEMFRAELIAIDHHELKRQIGFDTKRKFFSAQEIMRTMKLHEVVQGVQERRAADSQAPLERWERKAQEVQSAAMQVAMFQRDLQFPIIPRAETPIFASVGTGSAEPGYEQVHKAFWDFRTAYLMDQNVLGAVQNLRAAISEQGHLPENLASNVEFEYFYNQHRPWIWAGAANIVALLCLVGLAVTRLKLFAFLAGVAIAATLAEQFLGLYLRVVILDRAPVSNTYEVVLWMGIVSVLLGLGGQLMNRKSMYLAAGLVGSLLCIVFSQMVPLTDQTNAIPAVLRSNYWLVIHVMTICASYGAFLLAAVLGHAYLIRDVLLRRPPKPEARLIVQSYRLMQFGLVLLTVGTILGGVWAAESWGRFWGWDPKETWALISIVLYFLVLHARYVGWVRDFGLAVLTIVGFISIVWTFYGVNYVMATGLHSYGFGSGGEKWVGLWAVLEIAFLALCFMLKGKTPPRARVARETNERIEGSGNAPAPTA